MIIFIDTNILLDVLARRSPFYDDAAKIWSMAETGEVKACISAISFNNIYYIVRKLKDKSTAEEALRLLRDVFQPIAPDGQILNQAIDAGMSDFEDAIQLYSASRAKAKFLITRNPDHFPKSTVPIISPSDFLATFLKYTNPE